MRIKPMIAIIVLVIAIAPLVAAQSAVPPSGDNPTPCACCQGHARHCACAGMMSGPSGCQCGKQPGCCKGMKGGAATDKKMCCQRCRDGKKTCPCAHAEPSPQS